MTTTSHYAFEAFGEMMAAFAEMVMYAVTMMIVLVIALAVIAVVAVVVSLAINGRKRAHPRPPRVPRRGEPLVRLK